MKTTKEIWAERVKAWRESGVSSPMFCEGKDFRPGGLRYWASRLEREARVAAASRRASSPKKKPRKGAGKAVGTRTPSGGEAVSMARVIRTSPGAPPVVARSGSIVFDFAGVHVAVEPDFDRAAMRDLLALFGENSDAVPARRSR